MTLRLALRIDGDAGGAKRALDDTTRALDKTGDATARQGKEAAKSANDNATAAARIKQVADQLRYETEQLGRNAQAQAVENALRKAGVSAQSVQGQEIAKLAARHATLRAEHERAAKASLENEKSIMKLARVSSVAGGQVGALVGQTGALFSGASRLGGVITGVALVVGLLAVGTYKAVTAYAALEAQQAKTANVLRATGNASGQTVAGLERNAEALGRVGTQSLEDIRAASNELLRYRITSDDTFKSALLEAQKLANLGFVPLKDAAAAFGQAFRNPVEGLQALEAAGLRYTAAQADVIRKLTEGGESAKAFNEILRISAQQIGEANVNSANTLTASYGKLSNSIGTVFERAGDNFAKFLRLKGIMDGVTGAADRLSNLGNQAPPAGAIAQPAPLRVTVTPLPSTDRGGLSDLEADKLNKVTIELDRQTKAARLNETAQQQLTARQLAGVDAENSQAAAIRAGAAAVNQKVAALAAERFMQQTRAAFITQAAALKIEAETLGQTAGATAAYRYEQEKLADAKSKGIQISPKSIAELKNEAVAIGELTQKTAALRLEKDLAFERAQLGRGDTEARVAQDLRAAGVGTDSADGQRLAAQIRLNEQLRTGKDLATDFTAGFARDFKSSLRDGANAWDAFRSAGAKALDSLADKLIDMAAKNLVAQAFSAGTSGSGGLLGLIAGLFGGGASVADPTFGGFSAAGTNAASVKFDAGGYTGPGGRYDPAGIVHRGEYVFDQSAVNRIGVSALARLHKGYAEGGYVGPLSMPPAQPGASPAGGAPIVNIYPAAPGETFDAKRNDDGSIDLVGRMIDERLDTFSRRALPTRVHQINADPRAR